MSTRPPLDERAVAVLACPVCAAPLAPVADASALRCADGHLFDRARQGHVSLLPPGHRPPSGDSAGMVADRVAFLEAGHYAGLTGALADAVDDGTTPATLLDLGGGTGHHLGGVLDRLPDAVGVVLDSSRYAARRAARAHARAVSVVADTWARVPVADAAVDRVLVVFAPRNGPEIARVLSPVGQLVVVTPAADHLAEIVAPLGLLRVDPDKAARLAGRSSRTSCRSDRRPSASSSSWTGRRSPRWSAWGRTPGTSILRRWRRPWRPSRSRSV